MKKIMYLLSVALLSLIFCLNTGFTASAAPEDANKAVISGRGVICVEADTARISFGIDTRESTMKEAQSRNDKILKKIQSSCKKYGCFKEESYYSYEDPSTSTFFVSRWITFITTNMKTVADVTEKLTDNGASSVNNICYGLSDLKPYEENVLRLAVADAENKAKELGLNLKISEITEYGCYVFYDEMADRECKHLVTVTCDVSVVFVR